MDLLPPNEMTSKIRKKRQKIGLEQQKLAKITGMSNSQLNRIEKGTIKPSYQAIYQLWNKLQEIEEEDAKTAKDVMNEPIEWIDIDATVEEAAKIMRENDYSQLPVKNSPDSEAPINSGRITERRIMEAESPEKRIQKIRGSALPEMNEDTKIDTIKEILKDEPAVLIKDYYGKYAGIITKSDVI